MQTESANPAVLRPYKPWLQHQPYEILEPERECTNCDESWPLDSDFWYRDAKNPAGLTTQCKACLSEKKANKRGLVSAVTKAPEVELSPAPVAERPCTTCKVVKPLTSHYFRAEAGRPAGFSSQCKVCRRAKEKERVMAKRLAREEAKAALGGALRPLTA